MAISRPDTEEVTTWQPDYDPVERRVGRSEFKIGGVPSWAQDPAFYRCACGAEMVYLSQVPVDLGFEKRADRPEQPDTFSSDHYGLFLWQRGLHPRLPRALPPSSGLAGGAGH